jgi:hypothetical protein
MMELLANVPAWVSSQGIDVVLVSWLVAAVGALGSLLGATRTLPDSHQTRDCHAC